MSGLSLRLATGDDRPAVIGFVNAHWGSRHPALNLPEYFDYYYNAGGKALRFALAEQEGRIAAAAGFIPASGAPQPDVWVSLWVSDPAVQGAGLELMAALPALTGCRTLACNNIRAKTVPFYEFLGYTAGRVEHYYRLARRAEYRLARVPNPHFFQVRGEASLHPLPSMQALHKSGFVPPEAANPYKDLWYIARRYFAFPHRSYSVYGVQLPWQKQPQALLVTRTEQVDTSSLPPASAEEAALAASPFTMVLRVVDYIGPSALLTQCGRAFGQLLEASEAEYADCYCVGVPPQTMAAAGFARRLPGDGVLIPNYLSPPLLENTEYYYFTSRPQGFCLFKADGDQDRPNLPVP